MFAHLAFRYPFRKYQRMILEQIAAGQGDHKHHLVAPPGAGKTIVGLELVRRFNQPAVIFAPTSTIQAQWREKLRLFLPEKAPASDLEALCSLDPTRLAPINIFTYQLISTPSQSETWLKESAEQRWLQDLLLEGRSIDEQAARARLETLRQNNPAAFQRERALRALRIKRELLTDQAVDVGAFLHPNARQLIASLLAAGVRTLVLDECHHLLDYWAIVLRHLMTQILSPQVVGLTATLPSPEDDREYENYTSLLGDVDFEVPTPAVVKEGDLAPYRDLTYFVQPSRREMSYLRRIHAEFTDAISELTSTPRFTSWVASLPLSSSQLIPIASFPSIDHSARTSNQQSREIPEKNSPRARQSEKISPPDPIINVDVWEKFLTTSPLLGFAALRFLHTQDCPIPAPIVALLADPSTGGIEMTLGDWATLLERYGLDLLKLSPNPADHSMLARLRHILQPFGYTLTERGLRQGRSPGDLVLTFSESKDAAVADILRREAQAQGQRLRAVVVTDFERLSSGVRTLKDVLDPDAGSALRLFSFLARLPELDPLVPILATGRSLWVDAHHGEILLQAFNTYLQAQNRQAVCSFRETPVPEIREVIGEGKDWSSRLYIAMVTHFFERGLTRCLVGTRGIFGEGWDSLALNTLIDLTSVTTSTGVQQLRGRSIRLDPAWPRKLAHNWDVVCVAPKFEKGDADLRRFLQRHERVWGIVPRTPWQQILNDASQVAAGVVGTLGQAGSIALDTPLGDDLTGQVVRGITHVSPQFAYDLVMRGFKRVDYTSHTRRMLDAIDERDAAYDLWRVGDEYSNFAYHMTRLDATDLRIRTVFTIQNTLERMLRQFIASLLGGALLAIQVACQVALGLADASPGALVAAAALTVTLGLGVFIVFLANLRSAWRLGKALLIQQPPDAILLDAGRAILTGLQDAGLVSRNLQAEYVRVARQPDNSYTVLIDYATPQDAAVFIQSYRELFEPVRDQRYLIRRDETRLPNIWLRPLWSLLRRFFHDQGLYQPAYHPVPRSLSTRKELAEAFAAAWTRYVGGGELIFTRSEPGRLLLLQARAEARPKVKSLAFEIWR